MKVVLDTRPGSGYADSADRYHFPARSDYDRAAREAIGDWAVLYEPSRGGGRSAYLGVARIISVEPDRESPGHNYAYLSDYLPFDRTLPFRSTAGYRESFLRAADPRSVGRAMQGRSIRRLEDRDFAAIVADGLSVTLSPENRARLDLLPSQLDADTAALIALPDLERRSERLLTSRVIRDASFRNAVLGAYDATCAITGLRIINGGGRAEAQAAHIVPVELGGPDIVQNGIALSATAHWLFDRHLVSVGEDWRLLVSHNKIPAELRALFAPHEAHIRLPVDHNLWPHPSFLAHHRERFASG